MKKRNVILAAILSLTTLPALAQDKVITFGSFYAAGGGTSQAIQALEPSLNRQGYAVKAEYVKSCAIGFDLVKNGKVDFLATAIVDVSTDPEKATEKCPATKTVSEDFSIITGVRTSPIFMCGINEFKTGSVDSLKKISFAGKKIRIAVTDDAHEYMATEFFKNQLPTADYVILKFSGSSKIKLALAAGDLDITVGASAYSYIGDVGGTCFASSMKTNNNGVPFYGDGSTGKVLPELEYTDLFYGQTNKIIGQKKDALITAFKSPEYAEYLNKVKGVHLGIGTGETGAMTKKKVMNFEMMTTKK